MNGLTQFLAQDTPPGTNIWALERTADPILSQPIFWWVVGTIIVTSILLFLIARVPSNFRKPLIVGVTFLCGFYYVAEWLIPKQRLATGEEIAPVPLIGNWLAALPVASSTAQIISAMLLVLGVISIFRVHFGRLLKAQKDWFFSAVLLISMFTMLFFGMANFSERRSLDVTLAEIDKAADAQEMSDRWVQVAILGGESQAFTTQQNAENDAFRRLRKGEIAREEFESRKAEAREVFETAVAASTAQVEAAAASGEMTPEIAALARAGARAQQSRGFIAQSQRFVFTDMLQVLDAATFSLIAFFILSAAFRAFRLRSIEATILMFTALIILLSFVPLGLAITSGLPSDQFIGNLRLDSISDWILAYLNTPAIRAINLGLALGVLAMGMRILFGLERGVSE
jgi:hypothetical protein